MAGNKELLERRRRRVRWAIAKRGSGRPRLSVFRSNKHIYAQLIDDGRGVTIAAASTIDKALRDKLKSGGDAEAAREVGKLLADRAIEAGAKEVVFDRGGYVFRGRIKALADAAREAGLSF